MLSNDVWRIAIDVEMEPYEEALSIIRGDLVTVGERKQEFTFNSCFLSLFAKQVDIRSIK